MSVSVQEHAKQAASEVLAGQPKASARRWLGPVTLIVLLLFIIDTYLVATQTILSYDVPVARFIQSFPWGPLVYPMELLNWLGGSKQIALGAVAIVVLFVIERRAGWLMLVGGISSALDNVVKASFQRHRPTADLVSILTPASGYSYPSGHAVFFTWMSFMLVVSVAPRINPALRWIAWTAAAIVILLAMTARVWAGDHWPSDVIGGFLLGLGWSTFVLWLPERWLPSPNWTWFRGRVRPVA